VQRHAEIMAELLFVNDPTTASGFSIQVRALHVGDGSFMGSGLVSPAEERTASLGATTPPSVNEEAKRLGAQTGLELVRLLQRGLEQ
jgi:hypothetical protein